MTSITRLIEFDAGFGDLTWEYKECKNLWQFTEGSPQENNYNYCSKCGRKIIEYVEYNDNYEDDLKEE